MVGGAVSLSFQWTAPALIILQLFSSSEVCAVQLEMCSAFRPDCSGEVVLLECRVKSLLRGHYRPSCSLLIHGSSLGMQSSL